MKETSKIDMLDLFTIFAKRKKLILTIMLIATIIGFVLAFIWPKSYKSEVSFIVTDGNSVNFSSGGILSGLANLSVNGSNVTSDQTLVLIRNKEIQNDVIEKFNLKEVYGIDVPEALRKKLDNQIVVEEKREGGLGFNTIISIAISYTDGDPERAFELVKYYYDQVELKVEDLNRKNVEDGYLLLKNRLEQNEEELQIAEDSLVSFQTRYGILEVEEQARAQIEGIAALRTEIVKLEVEIGYVKEVLGENSSKISDLRIRKQEFERKYNQLVNGTGRGTENFDMFQSASEMPELFIEYLRRYRDVVVQEEIYKVLYPQFEQQKLNFEEVNSGLRIIDPALYPTYKDGPKRAYIIIAIFMFGFIVSLITVLIQEWKRSVKENSPEDYERLKEFSDSLTSWK
ncbi:MAG: GNVR domain-containing protein [Balneola sp.]